MKVKELIQILEKYPDHEVQAVIEFPDEPGRGVESIECTDSVLLNEDQQSVRIEFKGLPFDTLGYRI